MPTENSIIFTALLASGFFAGWNLSSYGPMIPIFSRDMHLDQTHYSYIMVCRMVGSLTGMVSVKFLPNHFSSKSLIVITSAVTAAVFLMITFSLNDLNLAFCYTIASFCSSINNAIAFGITFQLFPAQPAFYIQLRGLVHGLGAITGPTMVGLIQLNNYVLLCLCQLIPLAALIYSDIPNVYSKRQEQQSTLPLISTHTELLICVLYLCYCVLENGLASWIPTYAIKAGVSEVEGSHLYSLMFWLPTTICRLLWLYVPGSVLFRLKVVFSTLLFSTALCWLFQAIQLYEVVCYLSPISNGMLVASVFTFCLSLPSDEGFQPTSNNTVHFMLAYTVGEGLLNTPIGYSMRVFSFRVLIFTQVMAALGSWGVLRKIEAGLREDKGQFQKKERLLDGNEMRAVK